MNIFDIQKRSNASQARSQLTNNITKRRGIATPNVAEISKLEDYCNGRLTKTLGELDTLRRGQVPPSLEFIHSQSPDYFKTEVEHHWNGGKGSILNRFCKNSFTVAYSNESQEEDLFEIGRQVGHHERGSDRDGISGE